MSLLALEDKRILITGALGALGLAVVKVLAEHGAIVMANDILSDHEAKAIMAEAGFPENQVCYI